jgi:succinate-acetate transporter protein
LREQLAAIAAVARVASSRVNDSLSPRVFLRPIGSPLTLAMSGLGIASLLQSGFDLHWVAKAQQLEVGILLLAAPFLLQGLASVLCYLARDGAVGSTVGVLATTWLSIGLVHVVSAPGGRNGALGLMLLASATMLVLSSITLSAIKPLPAGIFGLVALRFALAAIYELGGVAAWRDAAGIAGLVVIGGAAYCALAFDLEGLHRRPVLPTFRRGAGRSALLGSAEVALEDVVHDPGVRHTT